MIPWPETGMHTSAPKIARGVINSEAIVDCVLSRISYTGLYDNNSLPGLSRDIVINYFIACLMKEN